MVTNTTIYTRQQYVSLSSDTPDVDFHNGDEMYVIDTLQRLIYDEENNTWHPLPTGGGGDSALPSVTSADNGKVLSVVDGAWAADEKRFVVTLTPTGPDYSGTMDKTSAEIDEAWNSGKIIWFKVGSSTSPLARRSEGAEGNSYSAYIINENMRALIMATTNIDSNRYEATIYQLTPLGS